MREVVLGLGSNCGERLPHLRSAIAGLRRRFDVIAASPLYESDALLPPAAPADWGMPFLNLALLCRTSLAPIELLRKLKSLEQTLGRAPRGRWAPREIDVDILAIRGETFRSPELEVPHPSLVERPFALLPFLDLAPDWLPELAMAARGWVARPPSEVPFRTRRSLTPLCEIVGILNVTPDSFSDGGKQASEEAAIAQGLKLIQDGASVLDIGGESTRPGATLISHDEEWRRIGPVIRGLQGRGALLSVDTRHPETALRALDCGVDWINDVSGFSDPRMLEAVREWECTLVAMHSLSVPADPKKHLPLDCDPVDELLSWARKLRGNLEAAGIDPARAILDPGLGFGKTARQSVRLLDRIGALVGSDLSARWLVGHSRKSFITNWKEEPPSDRDLETAVLSVHLTRRGVDCLRVHDARSTLRGLQAWIQVDGCVCFQ